MVSSKQTSASPSRPPAPVTSDQPSTSPPLFGLPAVTIPVSSVKPEAQLQNRNILWTSITSAGESLPLPLDSCCSVSLVSKLHADFVASKRPDLKYCILEERISASSCHHGNPDHIGNKYRNCFHYARTSRSCLANTLW